MMECYKRFLAGQDGSQMTEFQSTVYGLFNVVYIIFAGQTLLLMFGVRSPSCVCSLISVSICLISILDYFIHICLCFILDW